MMKRRLSDAEYGYSNTTLYYITFLSLPVAMISTSMVHHIAHYRAKNDEARLQGLLAGCQKFLLQATIGGSLLAVVLAGPLGRFFDFRPSLVFAAVICVLVSLWSGFALGLCQGMGWFKRLALIGVGGVCMRIIFGWIITQKFPTAEMAVTATTFSLLANLALLYWWKDIFRHGSERVSPWNREFGRFALVTAAYVAGNWFFLGDGLAAQKYFPGDVLGAYQVAARWAFNLPGTIAPLLLVMFSSRSGGKEGEALKDQRILLTLYAIGLACGAAGIILLRHLLVHIICGDPKTPGDALLNAQSADMLIPYTITMGFVGLSQAIGLWSLASRWFKVTTIYGILGLAYWVTLMSLGHTPALLLHLMPIGTATAFGVLLVSWLLASRHQPPLVQDT